jgi:hypothetical protein
MGAAHTVAACGIAERAVMRRSGRRVGVRRSRALIVAGAAGHPRVSYYLCLQRRDRQEQASR